MEVKDVKVYANSDVLRVVALIPEGHSHIRLILEFKDQIIVVQEATAAAIVRAYVDIITHPMRRAVELVSMEVSKDVRKKGYAEHQLIESAKSEYEVMHEWSERLFKGPSTT